MSKVKALLILLAAAGWLIPAAAWAGPYEVFGTGPRAIAMGGAYSALGEDLAGVYYNIASITQVKRLHVEFGYVNAEPEITLNGVSHDLDPNRGAHFGVIVSNILRGHRLSFGANVFIPDDHVMRFLVLPSDHPHFVMTANANHTVVAIVGVGFEVFPWMSIGFGSNVLGDNVGGVDFEINENDPSRGSLRSEIGSYFSPVAGLWFRPFNCWRIGASYREKVEMELDLPNTIKIPPITAFHDSGISIIRESNLVLLAYTWSHFSPRQFTLGNALQLHPRLLTSFDLVYMQWSEMKTDAPYSFVYLSGGLADIFPTENGSPPPGPNAHDTINPSVGGEFHAVDTDRFDMFARTGYGFRPTPIPEQTGFSNYLDTDTHIVGAGLGFTFSDISQVLPRPFSFDLYTQFQFLERRVMHKTDPNNKIGDLEIEGYWWNLGGNITLRF